MGFFVAIFTLYKYKLKKKKLHKKYKLLKNNCYTSKYKLLK